MPANPEFPISPKVREAAEALRDVRHVLWCGILGWEDEGAGPADCSCAFEERYATALRSLIDTIQADQPARVKQEDVVRNKHVFGNGTTEDEYWISTGVMGKYDDVVVVRASALQIIPQQDTGDAHG